MPFFDKYPYDSAHELNLDWLIANMKKLLDIYDQLPSDLQKFVDEWLDAHPEATTTVQDGSITPPKLLANAPEDGQILSYDNGDFHWVTSPIYGNWKIVQVDCENRAASTVIINEEGEFIIIDFGDATAGPLILSAILVNGGNVCKGVIISHFHPDHIGGYQTVFGSPLISLGDGCTAYLQRTYPDNWGISQSTLDAYDDFVAYFEGLGGAVVVPDERTDYNVMDLKTRFYNVDYSYVDYQNDAEFFNNMSLCNTIQIGTITMGCWGDIYFEAQDHIMNTDSVGPCDIVLAPHHGLATRINRSFMEALDPRIILMNLGSTSASQDTTFYNSAIRTYADETVKYIVDVNEGNVLINVSGDGSFSCDIDAVHYPQIIRHYPSMRNAVNLRNTIEVQDAQTGITDLLELMEPNSEISMEISASYKIATDLGLTTASFIHIIKTTGGSTNNLWNRSVTENFYFIIEVYPASGNTQKRSITGSYIGGVWSASLSMPPVVNGMMNVATDGTITTRFLTGITTATGKFTLPVAGEYMLQFCNTTSANGTVSIDGSTVGGTIYSHSATFTSRTLTAGEHTIAATGNTMTVYMELVQNSTSLDLSAFA